MLGGATGLTSRLALFLMLTTIPIGLSYVAFSYIFELGVNECVSRVVISKLEQDLKDVKLRQEIINEVESLGADDITERLRKYHVPIKDDNNQLP